MRQHLVAILIAGLTLLPIHRVSPLGMPDTPQPTLADACYTCPETMTPGAAEPDPCCAKSQAEDASQEAPEPCRKCPPICCALTPALALALPDLPPPAIPEANNTKPPRASDERAISRNLAPDPPVPIS